MIEKGPDDPRCFAYAPDLPGCATGGLTTQGAPEIMRDAPALYLKSLLADDLPVPQPPQVVREQIPLALAAGAASRICPAERCRGFFKARDSGVTVRPEATSS